MLIRSIDQVASGTPPYYAAEVHHEPGFIATMQNEDFRRAFGGRVKQLRKQKRGSQKELGRQGRYPFPATQQVRERT